MVPTTTRTRTLQHTSSDQNTKSQRNSRPALRSRFVGPSSSRRLFLEHCGAGWSVYVCDPIGGADLGRGLDPFLVQDIKGKQIVEVLRAVKPAMHIHQVAHQRACMAPPSSRRIACAQLCARGVTERVHSTAWQSARTEQWVPVLGARVHRDVSMLSIHTSFVQPKECL